MNKNIQDLVKKSGIDIRHIEKHADEDFEQHLEEFANLLVRECAWQIIEHWRSSRTEAQLETLMRKHFGVSPS